MPHIPLLVSNDDAKKAVRVLVTGFGPFGPYEENPSWLAVQKLDNILLEAEDAAEPVILEDQEILSDTSSIKDARPIHITARKVRVTYADVLSTIPKFHARPPTLPNSPDDSSILPSGPPPPPEGYDLILHVGVGLRGNLRVERLGHKFGYDMPDVDGKLAPEVKRESETTAVGGANVAEHFERARLGLDFKKPIGEYVLRGFAEGYEQFAEELTTDVDVDALVEYLHDSGIDQVQASSNAGRYLCDFIYYCSLAEALRTKKLHQPAEISKSKQTKVMFMHCPPLNDPLTSDYVADALKRIVAWVCGKI